jgi:nucleotide-binding universal stress UspA family protein
VTLPTILVGMQIGLFPEVIFAATMMMILATSFTSPLIVRHYGAKLGAAEPQKREAPRSVFDRIVVSVFNPHTQDNLLTLASILAKAKHGALYVLRVTQATGGKVKDPNHRQAIPVEHLQEDQFACHVVTSVDSKPAEGILHTAIEKDATLLLLGWRGKASFRQSIFGTVLDEVVWQANLPVMVVRLAIPVDGLQHVTLVMTPNSIPADITDETYEIARVIAHALNIPLTVVAHRTYVAALQAYLKQEHVEHPKAHEGDQIPILELASDVERDIRLRARATELIMVTTTGSRQRFQSSLGKLPERLANETDASMAVIYYPS